MANTCRDCPNEIKQPSVGLIAGDLIWGDTKDGTKRVLLEVKPHFIYCNVPRKPRAAKPKSAPVKEPEFIKDVRSAFVGQGYRKDRVNKMLAKSEGVDFDSKFASMQTLIAAEITT